MSTQPAHDPQRSVDAMVGERIHMLMWRAGMIQKDLAPKLGVQQSALAKKLRGQRGWSVEEVIRAARELHVTTSYLVGETDDDTLGQVTPGAGAGPNLPPRLYKGDDSNVIPLFGAQTFERIAA